MSDTDTIANTLQEIAPLVDAVDVIVQPEGDLWHIGFNDGEIMSLVLNQEARSLSFVSHIGPVPKENRAQALEAMLLSNSLWSTNGGVHLALDEKGEISLVIHCFADIDAPTLVAVIEDQREKADAWRKALPELGAAAVASDAATDADDGFLRV